MKRLVVPVAALVVVGILTGGLRGDDLVSRLPSGPDIGSMIAEFSSESAAGPHMCWSCYG